MGNLINSSFFIRDINIPNTEDPNVIEKIDSFCYTNERYCLRMLLGVSLFNAFISEANGAFISGKVFGTGKNDEQIRVGTTVGLTEGLTSFVFDGSLGTKDYRGYSLVVSELNGRGIMILGVDYSWSPVTGVFQLLTLGDVLLLGQWYNVHFEPLSNAIQPGDPVVNPLTDRMSKLLYGEDYIDSLFVHRSWEGILGTSVQSLLAYYVYFEILSSDSSYHTGVNISRQKGTNSVLVPPTEKLVNSWNKFSDGAKNLLFYISTRVDIDGLMIYQEVDQRQLYNANRFCQKINFFGI